MNYLIWSSAQQQNVALGEAVIVCVDKESIQKTLIPEIIREKIIKIEKTVEHDLNNR